MLDKLGKRNRWYTLERTDEILIRPTLYTTFYASLSSFIKAIILTSIVLLFLYLPDFILDYSQKGQEVITFFTSFLALILLSIALVASVHSIINSGGVRVHKKEKRIYWGRRSKKESIAFREVESLQIEDSFLFGPQSIYINTPQRKLLLLKVGMNQQEFETFQAQFKNLIA